jgi:ABC-type branched-subunit amino acid transport system substrate-binding protein
MADLHSSLARRPLGTCTCWMLLLAAAGCNVFDEELEKRLQGSSGPRECTTHDDCEGELTACTPDYRCVPLETEHCARTVGELTSNAIVLGSMFSTTGAQAATNIPRQQSAMLAIEEINAVGGVPGPGSSKRPLVLVSCDEVADLDAAAGHLIDELKVPAIVGPNVSQDVIEVSNRFSIAGGTVLISPTAVASSIADLVDDDLTWTMIPNDEQRAPLMKQQILELEAQIREENPDRPVRLSIIHRNDALGVGTRAALNDLTFNGMTLAQNLPPSKGATIEPYGATDSAGQAEIVERQLQFQPDIIVMGGLAEAITQIMDPLEQRWTGPNRPHYILIDSLKVPELLKSTSGNEDLRKRVRGTGIVPTAASEAVYEAFQVSYRTRFPDQTSTISGMGPAYDGAYAIAYALAATRDMPLSGESVAQGLRKLGGPGSRVELQSTRILAAFAQLTGGNTIQALGTFAPLQFNEKGSPSGGRVEIWCIAPGAPSAQFAGSGLTLDLQTGRIDGSYEQCDAN